MVSQTIQIEGVPLHVVDTAGLRDSQDQVEQIGIERAWGQIDERRRRAVPARPDALADRRLRAGRRAPSPRAWREKLPQAVPVIDVWNKLDAAPMPPCPDAGRMPVCACPPRPAPAWRSCAASCWTWPAGSRRPKACTSRANAMCRRCARVDAHLCEASAHLAAQAQSLDLLAEELRLAQNALNEITGEFSVGRPARGDLLELLHRQVVVSSVKAR